MLGMMKPTPSISRKRVRKRIASARLSSTAPPVLARKCPMIGTPWREVNRGRGDQDGPRPGPSESPRGRQKPRRAGGRVDGSHGGRYTANLMGQERIDDVVVVGGGIIGCAIAREAARGGLRVRLLEKGAFGREASGAAAGLL